jgi:REP element-mobilizing transposase RayT
MLGKNLLCSGAEECLLPYTKQQIREMGASVSAQTCSPGRVRPGLRAKRAMKTVVSIGETFRIVWKRQRELLTFVCQNLGMQFYRRNLPHLQKDFTPHFITFVTKLRWTLPPLARDIVLASCCHDHRIRYELYAAVVMPDHVHMILTPLVDERRCEMFSLVRIMQAIKGASARAVNQGLGRHDPVWQEESFDHVLRSSEGLDAKVDYVLQNPVRRGLVQDWREYRWTWQREGLAVARMAPRSA